MRKNLLIVLLFSLFLLAARYSSDVVGFFTITESLTISDDVIVGDSITFDVDANAAEITPANLGSIIFNKNGDDTNVVIEGDTDPQLFITDAGLDKIGVGKTAPEEKLEVGGNVLIANDDSVGTDSWKLILRSDVGGTEQVSSLYSDTSSHLVMSVPDNATGVETDVIHFAEAAILFTTDNTMDIGATGATRPKDIFLSGNLDAEAGSIAANTTITADTGAITATAGAVVAGTTVTGGTGVVATTGDIQAAAGDIIVDGGEIGLTGDLDLMGLAATDLTVNGDVSLTNAGGDSNSYKLKLEGHMTAGDETQTSSIRTAWGLDPYMIIATPDAVGAETDVVHLDTVSLRFANDNSADIGATGANRPKDIFLAGNLDAEVGAITAQTNITADTGAITATAGAVVAGTTMTAGTGITSTTGNIAASAGSVSASTTVTGGTGVTATTGDVTSSAGDVVDQYANVRRIQPVVSAAVPAEPFDCLAGTYGWMIIVDDSDDAAGDWLCVCVKLDDVPNYEWRKVDDMGSCF